MVKMVDDYVTFDGNIYSERVANSRIRREKNAQVVFPRSHEGITPNILEETMEGRETKRKVEGFGKEMSTSRGNTVE